MLLLISNAHCHTYTAHGRYFSTMCASKAALAQLNALCEAAVQAGGNLGPAQTHGLMEQALALLQVVSTGSTNSTDSLRCVTVATGYSCCGRPADQVKRFTS